MFCFCSDRDGYGGGREPRGYMDRPSGGSYRDSYDGYGKMWIYVQNDKIISAGQQRASQMTKEITALVTILSKTQKVTFFLPTQRKHFLSLASAQISTLYPLRSKFVKIGFSTENRFESESRVDISQLLLTLQSSRKCLATSYRNNTQYSMCCTNFATIRNPPNPWKYLLFSSKALPQGVIFRNHQDNSENLIFPYTWNSKRKKGYSNQWHAEMGNTAYLFPVLGYDRAHQLK